MSVSVQISNVFGEMTFDREKFQVLDMRDSPNVAYRMSAHVLREIADDIDRMCPVQEET